MSPGSALRQRTLTALVLAPGVLVAAWWLPTLWLAGVLALVVLLGAWEWTRLAGLVTPLGRLSYLGVLAIGCVALWFAHIEGWGPYLLVPVVLGWVLIAAYLVRVTQIPLAQGMASGVLALGLPLLWGAWLGVVVLDAMTAHGPLLVLSLLLLIWGADIAAYFAGRRWGRAKLAPVLSPGKTWVGCYAALVAGGCVGLGVALWLGVELGQGLALVSICVLTAAVSIVGDLFESLLKRRRGLKDSGQLLPGHGGMLDRIDSMIAAAPVFTLGLWVLL